MHELKKRRLQRGFTQVQLADLVGVNPQTIWKWENTERTPNPMRLRALEMALAPNGSEPESDWITNEYHVSYETAYRILRLLSDNPNGEVTMRISVPPNEPR